MLTSVAIGSIVGTLAPPPVWSAPALAQYWAGRRRKVTPPLSNATLRLVRAQDGRCPLCGDNLLLADREPASPREWEQWLHELEFDMRAALATDQLHLVHQPIYTLDDLTRIGVEALLRWDHPTRGEIQPAEFIPQLEASGQIVEVGAWVLREAWTQMAAWRARGSDLIVSVNVSGRQLGRNSINEHVRDALDHSGLDPAALTLEVTETTLMRDIDDSARRLRDLKTLGVHVVIDDFGTGYCSFAYLQRPWSRSDVPSSSSSGIS